MLQTDYKPLSSLMSILVKSFCTKCYIPVLASGFDLLVLYIDTKLAKIAKTHTAFKISLPQPPNIPIYPWFYGLEY